MSVEQDFYSDVTGDAGVSAIVGTRVHPNVLPDDVTFEAIAYRTVSRTIIGGVCKQTRIQADLYARSYSELKALRDAFETLVDGKSNWGYIEGPDLYEEDPPLHHQVVDVVIS